ncbi:MAG: ribosome hibernation-promoting factor, HPF/YfiA family [Bacteroidia bacterium]
MNWKIQSIHFDADQQLKAFIQEKADKLLTFYDNIIEGEVILKNDNSNVSNKISEIKLIIPGKILFAKEQASTFEEATDNALEALRKQLTKHKEKIRGV